MSKEDSYFRLAVTNHSENYFKNKEKNNTILNILTQVVRKIIQLELLLFTKRKTTDFSSPTSASVNILDMNNVDTHLMYVYSQSGFTKSRRIESIVASNQVPKVQYLRRSLFYQKFNLLGRLQ